VAVGNGKLDFRLEGEAQLARLVLVETPLGPHGRIAPAALHRLRRGRHDSLVAEPRIQIKRIGDSAREDRRHLMRDVPRAGRLVDRAVVSRFDLVAAGALRAGVVGYERLESEAMAGSRKSVARATPGRGDENVPAIRSLLSEASSRQIHRASPAPRALLPMQQNAGNAPAASAARHGRADPTCIISAAGSARRRECSRDPARQRRAWKSSAHPAAPFEACAGFPRDSHWRRCRCTRLPGGWRN